MGKYSHYLLDLLSNVQKNTHWLLHSQDKLIIDLHLNNAHKCAIFFRYNLIIK